MLSHEKVPAFWTVGELKVLLSKEYCGKPEVSEQKLIYGGKILDNGVILSDATWQPASPLAGPAATTREKEKGEEEGEEEEEEEEEEEIKLHLVVQSPYKCQPKASPPPCIVKNEEERSVESSRTEQLGETSTRARGTGGVTDTGTAREVEENTRTSTRIAAGSGTSSSSASSMEAGPAGSAGGGGDGGDSGSGLGASTRTHVSPPPPQPPRGISAIPQYAQYTQYSPYQSQQGQQGGAAGQSFGRGTGSGPAGASPGQEPLGVTTTPPPPLTPPPAPQMAAQSPQMAAAYHAALQAIMGQQQQQMQMPYMYGPAPNGVGQMGQQQQQGFHMPMPMPYMFAPYGAAYHPFTFYPPAGFAPQMPHYMHPTASVPQAATRGVSRGPAPPAPPAQRMDRPRGAAAADQQNIRRNQQENFQNNNNNNLWNYLNLQLTLKLFVLGLIINHDGSAGRMLLTGFIFLFIYMQQMGLFSANGTLIQKFCAWYSSVFRRLDDTSSSAPDGTPNRPVNPVMRILIEVQWFFIILFASLLPSFSPESLTQQARVRPHQD